MVVRAPEGEDEYRCYLRLRYETLREPWGDPEGSELEDDDETAIHRMMIDEDSGEIVGVARLHFNSPGEAQIRLMAIKESHRRQNLGRQLIVEMEAIAHGEARSGLSCMLETTRWDFTKNSATERLSQVICLWGRSSIT